MGANNKNSRAIWQEMTDPDMLKLTLGTTNQMLGS